MRICLYKIDIDNNKVDINNYNININNYNINFNKLNINIIIFRVIINKIRNGDISMKIVNSNYKIYVCKSIH